LEEKSMAPYCNASDVSTEIQLVLSATSVPTEAQVSEFVNQAYAKVEGTVLALGFHPPTSSIDSPISFAILKNLNIIGAAARAYRAHTKSQTEGTNRERNLQKEFDDGLQDLRDHPQMLTDLAKISGQDSPVGSPDYAASDYAGQFVREDPTTATRY
jgi:hypothetical protein